MLGRLSLSLSRSFVNLLSKYHCPSPLSHHRITHTRSHAHTHVRGPEGPAPYRPASEQPPVASTTTIEQLDGRERAGPRASRQAGVQAVATPRRAATQTELQQRTMGASRTTVGAQLKMETGVAPVVQPLALVDARAAA